MFSHLSQILTFRLILNEIVISLKAPYSPSPANDLKGIDGDMEVQFKVLSLVTRCTLFLSCGLCYKTDKTNMSGCLLACDQFLDSN